MEDLRVHFGPADRPVRAVDGASFEVGEGEVVALAGESGCGKSVAALALARLVPEPAGRYAGGRVLWRGRSILDMPERELRALRGAQIAYVFQEPSAALNPVLRIGEQVAEAVRLHRCGVDARAEAVELLRQVGLPDAAQRARLYPHELSGGMQQRAVVAMALACRPRLLVADEPTTALDVTVQAQVLGLLADLQRGLGMAVLLITHNLAVAAELAQRLLVMYAGRIVEEGPAAEVLAAPAHPYTAALLRAAPRLDAPGGRVEGIPGQLPSADAWPPGCAFAPRCPRSRPACAAAPPGVRSGGPGRNVRCLFPHGGCAGAPVAG